jgi:hypothetical protein
MTMGLSIEQITVVLQQASQGVPVGVLCRKLGIPDPGTPGTIRQVPAVPWRHGAVGGGSLVRIRKGTT